jgi:hypothetical protein
MAAELCTRLHVLTAVLRLKCHSSQLKAVRSTVEPATRNTDGTRLISGLIRLNLFFSPIFFQPLSAAFRTAFKSRRHRPIRVVLR